jgi:hypothetical protein
VLLRTAINLQTGVSEESSAGRLSGCGGPRLEAIGMTTEFLLHERRVGPITAT